MKYVIVGGSAAAISAVEAIRSVDPAAQIDLFSDEKTPLFSRVLLPYYVAEELSKPMLNFRSADYFDEYGVTPHIGVRIESIDPASKTTAAEAVRKKANLPKEQLEFLQYVVSQKRQNWIHHFTELANANEILKKQLRDLRAAGKENFRRDVAALLKLYGYHISEDFSVTPSRPVSCFTATTRDAFFPIEIIVYCSFKTGGHLVNSADSIRVIFGIEAPMALRMPISRVFCSAVWEARPNSPSAAMKIARKVNMVNI